MSGKRSKNHVVLADQIGDTISQLLQQQTDALTSDDTPLSEEALPAAIRFIEAIQYGGMTEEQFMHAHPSDWRLLMHELDPNFPVEEEKIPHPLPRTKRKSRLL